jgi:hypothetical protein
VDRTGLMTLTGAAEDPVSHLRTALLVGAMFLSSILPFTVLYVPFPTHSVHIDIGEAVLEDPSGRRYLLRLYPAGNIILDGRSCRDFMDLGVAIEVLGQEPDAVIEVIPHPEARYEFVLEVLAVLRRSRAPHLLLDLGTASDKWSEYPIGPIEALEPLPVGPHGQGGIVLPASTLVLPSEQEVCIWYALRQSRRDGIVASGQEAPRPGELNKAGGLEQAPGGSPARASPAAPEAPRRRAHNAARRRRPTA